MALPKYKVSRARGRRRRTHYKLNAPTLVACPQCREMKLAHRVCKTAAAIMAARLSSWMTTRPRHNTA